MKRKETSLVFPFRPGELRVPLHPRLYAKLTSTLLCLSASLLGTAWAVPETRAIAQAQSMQSFIEHYSADHDSLASVYTDRLSPLTSERMHNFDAQWRKQLTTVEFAKLDQEGKADYLLFVNHLDREDH